MNILEANKQLLERLKEEEKQKLLICHYLTEELTVISDHIDNLEDLITLFEEDEASIPTPQEENGR